MTGNPDYQRYAQWRGGNLVSIFGQVLNADVVTGIFTIPHYACLYINFQVFAGQCQLFCDSYADSAGTQLVDRYQWFATVGTALRVTVPLTTQYVKFTADLLGGTTPTVNLLILPTNVGSQGIDYPVTRNNLINASTSYPANADTFTALPFIQAGPASIFFNPADTSGKLNVTVAKANPDGTADSAIWDRAGVTTEVNDILYLPDSPVGLRIHNTDGVAAHSATSALVPAGST